MSSGLGGAATACSPYRVELVDEHDRRGALLGLVKQVAHTACPDARDHLDEFGSRERIKGHIGFARNRAREQGLPGPRRARQQHTPGNLGTQPAVPIRIA